MGDDQKDPADQFVVCILGMHRSGTSCLAGNLQAAGLEMGEVTTRSVPGSPVGTRESLYLRLLNDALLASHDAGWDRPSNQDAYRRPQGWTRFQQAYRDLLLSRTVTGRTWGIKDPRMLLLLEFWEQGIGGMTLIGSVRHPLEVARSLEARNALPLMDGIALWEVYNRRLLEIYERAPFPICHFGVAGETYAKRLAELARWLSLEQRKSNEFFDASFINHTCTGEEDLPQPIKSLYERLIELAARPIESYDAPGPATLHFREHLATCSASELDAADVFLQAQQVLRKRDTRSARDMVCRARELWGSDEPLLERALETIDRAMA